uniref:ACT domain-containing protein n=1 Tax=Lactobacillus gallinarum TaxID=52242 RepID=UPI003D2F1868
NYILSNRSEWTFYFLSSVQFNFTIGEKDISIQMINQGASQISIMIGTRRKDEEAVIKTIYENFIAED